MVVSVVDNSHGVSLVVVAMMFVAKTAYEHGAGRYYSPLQLLHGGHRVDADDDLGSVGCW